MGTTNRTGRPKMGMVNMRLFDAMRVALRAWIKADLAEYNKPRLVADARRLTGAAVDWGLMVDSEEIEKCS